MKLHEIVGDKMPKVSIMPKHKNYCKCPDCVRAIADKGFLEELNDIDIPTANVDEINEAIYTEGLMPLPDFGRAIAEKYWLIQKEGK